MQKIVLVFEKWVPTVMVAILPAINSQFKIESVVSSLNEKKAKELPNQTIIVTRQCPEDEQIDGLPTYIAHITG